MVLPINSHNAIDDFTKGFPEFEKKLHGPIVGFHGGTQAALKDQKLVTFESKKPVALTPYLSEQVWQVSLV